MAQPRISFLSEDEIEAIHNASLEVLENTGIETASTEALNILRRAGTKVNYEKNRASIHRSLVEEALKRAPKILKCCARNPNYDFMLAKEEPHFSPDGGAAFIRDIETGERRYATKEDLARWTRIGDYLNNVHRVLASLTPSDVPVPMRNIVEMHTCLSNSEKHVGGVKALSAREAQYEIEIAAAIVGGKEKLREKPIISACQCSVAPLTFEKGSIEAAIEFARAGVPLYFLPMPLMGETAPATVAGTLVVNNAENLAGLVISEFASSGAPVVYSTAAGGIDFKTGRALEGAPEYCIVQMASAQLARYYDLPSAVCGGDTDSKFPDIQAGFEKTMTITASILTGADLIVCTLGGLSAGAMMCLVSLVIDNEIIEAILRVARGFEVNDDTLAVDVIREVGPGGHFLGEKHTLQHYKTETWIPEISDKNDFETWWRMGSKTMDQLAAERVKEILATHKPEPIPEDTEKEISQILKSAKAEFL